MRAATVALLVLGMAAGPASAATEDADAEDSLDGAEGESGTPALDLDDILANPLRDDDYREQSACVWRRSIEDVEVLDETLVLFTGRRGELWLNQLAAQCYLLEDGMTLQFRVRGGNFCNLDHFRGVPPYDIVPVTAQCTLGSFESIDEMQLEAIRTAVEERRQVQDMARETRRQARKSD